MPDSKNQSILSALYPFSGDSKVAKPSVASAVTQKVKHGLEVKSQFFSENTTNLVAMAEALSQCYQDGGRLLTAGNGGSSCDAAHLCVEFMHPVTAGRPALPAINLSQDMAMMTAVANDIGFQHGLSRQLVALARANDMLVVFSTSGNSANLVLACEKAKTMGLTVAAFTGGDGGTLLGSGAVDYCLNVNTDSIHRIQECHLMCYHILWDLVHSLLAATRGQIGEHGQ